MTLSKAFASVACCAAACAVIGAVLGWGIGTFAPDAYRGWFAQGEHSELSTVQFGVGLGLAQGLLAGVVIGVAVVAIVAWHDVATSRRGGEPGTD